MVVTKSEFSLAVQTRLGYQRTLELLRQNLALAGFRIISQVAFHKELESCVGLHWERYTVLVVWSPFEAYQALLSHRDGGLLVPFNLVVAEDEGATLIAATNHASFSRGASIGTQVLAHGLSCKLQDILISLAEHGNVPQEKPDAQLEEVL